MGSSRWDPTDWQQHATRTASQTQQQIFTQRALHTDLNPLGKIRESCDSAANPLSTPIIIGVDDTGSMGVLAETIIKSGLGVIMQEIYDRKPVTDPHVLCAAIGDVECDRSPLQVTQFEASVVLADQVKNFHIEGGGGGNGGESYPLLWYFAAYQTRCDSQIKRGKKGYLFTIGDECPHLNLSKSQIIGVFGGCEADYGIRELLDLVQQQWEVFHLIVRPHSGQPVMETWKSLLGERAMLVSDHTKLAEVIVSTIQVIEGHDHAAVAQSWSGDTSLVVAEATRGLVARGASGSGVVRL